MPVIIRIDENPDHHTRITRRPHLCPRQIIVGKDTAHIAGGSQVYQVQFAAGGFEDLTASCGNAGSAVGIGHASETFEGGCGGIGHPCVRVDGQGTAGEMVKAEAYGNIATVYLRWEDPDTRQVVEMSKDFQVGDLARSFERSDPYFQRTVIVAEFAEIFKESYWAEGSSMDNVYREVVRVSEYFGRDEDMSELLELIRWAGHWIE